MPAEPPRSTEVELVDDPQESLALLFRDLRSDEEGFTVREAARRLVVHVAPWTPDAEHARLATSVDAPQVS